MKLRPFVAAPLLLSGCVAPPVATTPVPPSGAAGSFSGQSGGDLVPGEVPDKWWRLFDDPALDTHVTRALAANADLRVAVANLEVARAQAVQAGAARVPATVIESGLGPRTADNQPSTSSVPKTSYELGATLQYEVDLFGRVSGGIAAANADARAVEALQDSARLMVTADTTAAYVDYCGTTASLVRLREQVGLQERAAGIVAKQLALGEVSPLELSQSLTLTAQLESALPALDAARSGALYRLAVLQAVPANDVGGLAPECVSVPTIDQALPVGDGGALLARRPDIREAEARIAATAARIGVARADLYPRVSLGGSAGLISGGLDAFLTPLIAWSFPNRRAIRGRIAEAEGREAAALARWDATMLTALSEVETALANYRAERSRAEALRRALDEANATVRRSDARVRIGQDSYLIALTAQRTRADIAVQLAATEQRIAQAQVAIYRALGGGWQQQGVLR